MHYMLLKQILHIVMKQLVQILHIVMRCKKLLADSVRHILLICFNPSALRTAKTVEFYSVRRIS